MGYLLRKIEIACISDHFLGKDAGNAVYSEFFQGRCGVQREMSFAF